MSHKIARYHFAMSRDTFLKKRRSGEFNGFYRDLFVKEIPATADKFLPLLKRVGGPWGWDNKVMNTDESLLNSRLADKETRLFHLIDANRVIGYAIITRPSQKILNHMSSYFADNSHVIEIENLGLFPGQEGGGRGGKFFEMFFETLLKDYSYVYWSVSSTNHPGLFNYYKNKIGMDHIGTDYVDDFRSNSLKQDNQQQAA